MPEAPLIAHVLYRFGVGGLENGVVNLINHLPAGRYRHCVISLTDSGVSEQRLQRDVPVICMHKKPGNDPRLYWRLFRLFRQLRPSIVHTRNLGALDAVWPAWMARVPARIHGEHGWDVDDPDGENLRHQRIRRLFRPWIHQFIALSSFQQSYLRDRIAVAPKRVHRIINGVDTVKFRPAEQIPRCLPDSFADDDSVIIGTVGRMHGVKDQANLTKAFIHLCQMTDASRLRLLMIGDGPLREVCLQMLADAGLADQAWLPGARDDVADLMHAMKVFVLPSQTEGISNTILEAMACGLPVVATDVGGNAELVAAGETGALCPRAQPKVLATALLPYCESVQLRNEHGAAGRARVCEEFSLDNMLQRYAAVYDLCVE